MDHLEARRLALQPVHVWTAPASSGWRWPVVAGALAFALAVGSPHEPPRPPQSDAYFDGYPLIGPGMKCWFQDIRPEGEIIVHDLCERFLKAYRRYHK